MTNKAYGTLYVGVTGESHGDAIMAIAQEKRIKRWHRDWKVNLIQAMNPGWDDLFDTINPGIKD